MKTQLIGVDSDSDCRYDLLFTENLKLVLNEVQELINLSKTRLRQKLMEQHPDIDWAQVHDIGCQQDKVELITYEHPLEQHIGPMTSDEIEKIEKAREELNSKGLVQKVESN